MAIPATIIPPHITNIITTMATTTAGDPFTTVSSYPLPAAAANRACQPRAEVPCRDLTLSCDGGSSD